MENLLGEVLKSYKLEERIGSGGFGAVYRARQTTIGREVAIKCILPGYANNPDFIRRFESEAHLIARLEHPHITPLYDFWRDPSGAYLVMRHLRGGSIRDALAQDTFELPVISHLLDQIASALDFAHRNNVIHRDIKPANILLDEDGNIYLADFGIAKDLTGLTDNKTAADAVVGSLDYISPEQARNEPVTPHTDVYSLGVTLFELITGEHPFKNASSLERLYKHINDRLPEIDNLPDHNYDQINKIIQKATAKNPEDRYTDVLALALAFREGIGLGTQQDKSVVEQLTMREHEILSLISDGMSNREIADKLVVTVSTIKWHVRQLYKKLGVRSRVQAIVRARELDLIVTGDTTDDLPFSTEQPVSILLPEPENPYKGLHAFQMNDARDFFGRDDLTKKLIDKMCDEDAHRRFLAIVGPSGSGKSSLVKAGLIPALWKGAIADSERWFVVDMIPGTHPLDKLETALIRVAANQTDQLREQLQRDERGLLRVADIILPADDTELVIVVDQFEEVFTLVEDEAARQHFLDLLRVAVSDVRSRIRVFVTMRADYYDRPLHYSEFGELIRNRMETVLPLTAKGLERAVRGPAERVGMTFEQGLVEQIVSQMNYQAGALPLLQYALTELFDRREGRILTNKAYQEIGGAVGALANRADEIYHGLTEEGQELAHQMFMRLVTLGEGAEDTRRRAAQAELLSLTDNTDLMEEIIDQFAAYRLLSLDHDPETRQPTVEVAHEAILREWDRLRQWLGESREDIRLERQIAHAADAWQANHQDKSYLLSGSRLGSAEKWREMTKLALTPLVSEFFEASIQNRTQVQADTNRTRQIRQMLTGSLVAVITLAAIIAGGLALVANSQRLLAEESKQEALIQAGIGLAALAENELEGSNPERGILLALEALENYPHTPQAVAALARTVDEYRAFRIFEAGEVHTISFFVAAWSPDGKRVAGGGALSPDGVVIWDADTGDILLSFHQQVEDCMVVDPSVKQLVWSPSGDYLAVIGCKDRVIVWDSTSGDSVLTLRGYESGANSINWSPDGMTLLTGHEDGTARLWDATEGTAHLSLSGHTAAIYDAVWSPDGNLIATASEDKTVRLWDATSGNELTLLVGHVGPILAIDWSPDSTRLVTGGVDGLPRVWDVASGKPILALPGHTDRVVAVDWSPDGRSIASQSLDATARVWDAATGGLFFQIRNVAPGEGGYVSFSANGEELLVTDVDVQESRVWSWDTSIPTPKLFGHTADQYFGAWSPDGTLVATGSFDGTVRLWDPTTGEQLKQILVSEGRLYFGDWSPDSIRLVMATQYGATFSILDVRTGEELMSIPTSMSQAAIATGWSPDGLRIAGTQWSTHRSAAHVWDAITGEVLLTLQPDDNCMQAWPNWSPDNSKVITGCLAFGDTGRNTPARIWDAATGEHLMNLDSEHGWTYLTAWSPDGEQIVVTYEEGIVHIWDAETYEISLTFAGHLSQVFYAAWSPDGTQIASRDLAGVVKIWNPKTGEESMSFTIPGGEGILSWSPDGTHIIATGGFNVPIIKRVWRSTDELITYAYQCCVSRELTPEERNQFGLPER